MPFPIHGHFRVSRVEVEDQPFCGNGRIIDRPGAVPFPVLLPEPVARLATVSVNPIADAVEEAVTKVLDKGIRTVDIAEKGEAYVGTKAMGDAVCDEI